MTSQDSGFPFFLCPHIGFIPAGLEQTSNPVQIEKTQIASKEHRGLVLSDPQGAPHWGVARHQGQICFPFMLKHKSHLGRVFCFCFFLFLLKILSIVLSGTLPWREILAASPCPSLSDLGHVEEAMVLAMNLVSTAVHHEPRKPISPPKDFGFLLHRNTRPQEITGLP